MLGLTIGAAAGALFSWSLNRIYTVKHGVVIANPVTLIAMHGLLFALLGALIEFGYRNGLPAVLARWQSFAVLGFVFGAASEYIGSVYRDGGRWFSKSAGDWFGMLMSGAMLAFVFAVIADVPARSGKGTGP